MGKTKFTFEYVRSVIESYGHTLLSNEYINNGEKLNIRCKCGNDKWFIDFDNFKRKRHDGCSRCGIEKRARTLSRSEEEVRNNILEFGYLVDSSFYYENSFTKIILYDSDNYKYYSNYGSFSENVIKRSGKLAFVGPNNPFSFENIKLFIKINKLRFSIIEGYFEIGSMRSIICKCDRCGEKWDNSWVLIRSKSECPFCSGKRVTDKKNFAMAYPDLALEWDFEKNDKSPYEYTPKSKKEVYWICPECDNHYKKSIENRAYGQGCDCSFMSGGDRMVHKYLTDNQFIFDHNKGIFSDLVGDFRPLRYDYIVYKDLEKNAILKLIEFDGDQHIKFVPQFYGTIENFEKQKRYDEIKNKYAKEKGYSLLRVNPRDLKNLKKILDRELYIEERRIN